MPVFAVQSEAAIAVRTDLCAISFPWSSADLFEDLRNE
jgi:hypothetical protein